jgi:hypothetical protein
MVATKWPKGFSEKLTRSDYAVGTNELLFALISFFIFIIMLLTTDNRYMDFGDGNYLYTSWRFMQGARLYQEIMTPQPPLLFVIGSALLRVSFSWKTIRLFNILLGIATALVIYKVSTDLFHNRRVALLASSTYYLLPIHLSWGRGFQADSVATFLSLMSLVFFIAFEPREMVVSSALAVLATYTKYSVLPLLILNVVYLWLKRRRLLKFYLLPLTTLGVSSFLFLNTYSSGMFIRDTFIAQSKAPGYPLDFPIDIALNGLSYIFLSEGTFIFLSVMGLISLLGKNEERGGYLAGCLIGSFVPLALILRQGTGTYIFYGAEPYVAIFSAYFIYELMSVYVKRLKSAANQLRVPSRRTVLHLSLVGLTASSLYLVPCIDICFNQFINFQRYSNWSNAKHVEIVVEYIENYTSPSETILSPPYFAFLAKRRLLFDYSETWLWSILYEKGDNDAVRLVESITAELRHNRVKIVILDWRMKNTAPIYQATLQNYVLIRRIMVHDMLEIYVSKDAYR